MPISSETYEAIKSVCSLVLCPLCGRFADNNKYKSLMSCGHYFCQICVNTIVFKSNNKCPKCYQFNNKSDIKCDQFLTLLTKITTKLDPNQSQHNSNPIKSVLKELPKKEAKRVPKTQKEIIIESLKACISSCSKTKDKKSSEESKSIVENTCNTKTSTHSIPLAKSKAQIMIEMSADYDPNLESVPDSGDTDLRFTQNSSNINKDNDLMGKVTEIVDDLQSNTSNNSHKSDTDLDNKNSNESKSNDESKQKSDSNELKKNESTIPKKLNLEKKVKQKIFKSSAVLKSDESKKEIAKHSEKSTQVEAIEPKRMEEKETQFNAEEKKVETKDKGIQCLFKEKLNDIRVETTKSDTFSTIEAQVVVRNQQTNNSSLLQVLTKIIELPENLYPNLITCLNDLITNNEIIDRNYNNQNTAIIAKSVQEKELIDTKTEPNPELINGSEELMTNNDNINESNSKVMPIKPSKGESKKQNKSSRNTAKRSSVQMRAQSKKMKANETVSKSMVCDTIEMTPDLGNKESKTKPIETSVSRRPKRNTAVKKELIYSSSESEDNSKSTEQLVDFNRKVAPNRSKRKLLGINNNVSNDENPTKSNPRKQTKPMKRLYSKVKETKDIDEEENDDNSENDSIKRSRSLLNNKPNDKKFKRPQLPSPTPSNTSTTSSSASSRLRTSSTERPKPKRICILSSGLDETQKKKLRNVETELNADLVYEWTDSVTHLVVGLVKDRPKKELLCQRNLKYMKALLANKWIVSFDWILDSFKSNRFVDENNYEIKGVKSAKQSNAPNKSRTSGLKFFKDRMVCFKGSFTRIACGVKDIEDLVITGGGKVIQNESDFKPYQSEAIEGKVKLICVSETIGLPDTQNGIKYMSVNTFLDIISNFSDI